MTFKMKNGYEKICNNMINEGPQKFKKEIQVTNKTYKWNIEWRNVMFFIYFHLAALYGLYLLLTLQCHWQTYVWVFCLNVLTLLGTTAGSHRLWSHNSYKAKKPLKIFLMVCQSMSYQHHIYEWARDHRLHHRLTDTDADPHNSKRGFFYSHIGWLMLKKHKDVIEKGKSTFLRDLQEDPIVMFQKRHYFIIMPICCYILPTLLPWYFWGESLRKAWYTAGAFRYALALNTIWTVNSFAHIFGPRPYDKNILPTENIVTHIFTLGSAGAHNFHHTFPWDYTSSEFNDLNFTTYFLNFMSQIGQAYDFKSVPAEIIKKRMLRTGDGSKYGLQDKEFKNESHVWGWEDDAMSKEDRLSTIRHHPNEL